MLSARWHKVLHDVLGSRTRTALIVLSMAVGLFAVGIILSARTILSRMVFSFPPNRRPAIFRSQELVHKVWRGRVLGPAHRVWRSSKCLILLPIQRHDSSLEGKDRSISCAQDFVVRMGFCARVCAVP